MKKIFVSVFGLFLAVANLTARPSDPTLMKINGKDIPLSEFEYIYNKNNTNNVLDKKTLDEYVDLFVNFKLKVEEAIAQGLDTTQSFNSELSLYRNQLAEQYLTDSDMNAALLQEAYDRKKEEVEVSHILVKIADTGTAADTLAAYNKALSIIKRAQKEDFAKLAKEVSDDQYASKTGGYVGWVNALRTPYSFENAAFATQAGSVSKPVRTFLGYHIIKVLDRRPSQGEVHVKHIFLLDNDPNSTNKAELKARIDSIYERLKAGDDFGELAKKHSQDPGSARQNGELPWFGSGQMIPEFEKAAFALKQEGEYTEPVHTQVGWHIIQLIGKRPLAGMDELKSDLENQIKANERSQKIMNSFTGKLKKEYNFTMNEAAATEIYQLADKLAPSDSLFNVEMNKLDKPLFTISDKSFTQKDFSNYMLPAAAGFRGVRSDFIKEQLNAFINNKLSTYEQTQLDRKYPEFHYLMQEYHDGILLFEVSNREVWEKASKDTEGLTKFFESNKTKYAWQKPHYKGRIIYCKNKPTLKAARLIVKRAANDSIDKYLYQRLNDSIQFVKVEKGLWVEGENKMIDAGIFKKGVVEPNKDYPYYFISGKVLKTMPEDYTDVRGVITADYQDYLEKEWIKTLRQKYTFTVDEKVLKTVKKN